LLLAGLLLAACGGTFEVGIEQEIDATLTYALVLTQSFDTAIAGAGTGEAATATPETTPSLTVAASPEEAATHLPTESPLSFTSTPCLPPSKWVAYTVRPGDTLFVLSQQTNVTVGQLQSANCLKDTTIRAGQQLFLPFVPTPTATATFTPSPTWTPDPQAVFAPGGKRYATNGGLVVDLEQGRAVDVIDEASPWVSFWNWTTDGRFAIFKRLNQYGNGRMIIFDAQTWSTILETTGCSSPLSRCGEYPIALYPLGPRFLRADGWLTDLPARQTDLLDPWRTGLTLFVIFADWSPNAAWLAFVAGDEAQTEFALYLAQADGAQLRRTLLDGLPQLMQWTADSKSVVVTTTLNRYLMDVSSGQLQATPLVTATPTPSPSATSILTLTPAP
jgi:LysM repeat protein